MVVLIGDLADCISWSQHRISPKYFVRRISAAGSAVLRMRFKAKSPRDLWSLKDFINSLLSISLEWYSFFLLSFSYVFFISFVQFFSSDISHPLWGQWVLCSVSHNYWVASLHHLHPSLHALTFVCTCVPMDENGGQASKQVGTPPSPVPCTCN